MTRRNSGSSLLDMAFLKKIERLSPVSRPPLSMRPAARPRASASGSRLDRVIEAIVGADGATAPPRSLHIIVDASQTMMYRGDGETQDAARAHPSKFEFARKIAATLGMVALLRSNGSGVVTVSGVGHTAGRRVPRLRSRDDAALLFGQLERLRPGGAADFAHALQDRAVRAAPEGPGLCIVLSDFLDPHWNEYARVLLGRRFSVILFQILDPGEVKPETLLDLRLVDAETGSGRAVRTAPGVLQRYRDAMARFRGRLADSAAVSGMEYVHLTTDAPFEEMVLQSLRRRGTAPPPFCAPDDSAAQ